jgi:transposase
LDPHACGAYTRRPRGRRAVADAPRGPTPLAARRAAWLLTAPEARVSADACAVLDALCAASPALAAARADAQAFAQLVRAHDADGLTPWLTRAVEGPLASFARGLRRDEAAVRAALTEAWSNGQVEGQVHRLKLVKRTMYGRASFALLRRRVLAA